MIKQLLNNWKTSAAGLTIVITAVVHMVYAIHNHALSEPDCAGSLIAVVTGLGFVFAGDSSASASASNVNATAINKINATGSDSTQPQIPKQ